MGIIPFPSFGEINGPVGWYQVKFQRKEELQQEIANFISLKIEGKELENIRPDLWPPMT